MADDRGDRLVGIGLAGDGKANVVDGPEHDVARLQSGVAHAKIACQSINPAERVPRAGSNNRGHDRQHEQGVKRKRQEGIGGRVAQNLDRTDEDDGGDYCQPAAAMHP